ncbi:hypothetical protein PTSG_05483 [Salpingoeca rosetta]|uniref:TPPC8 first Ig-like domain-containing protein n=1 Tax=Salpingoeca rosetta (strain ATCC 50818 / BSB-021) TaxID=946362 RepID=F2UBC4_SALR5|nr:uncharacterized protein PTSG_05483 [Salpingoeca rosetta]EGD73790.1 hypothetical protein PTSG_05483 [Salpingoeca rosetta]|eukprot:XP_004993353.1 hypothetical protein PTSG_05483 [Salpingoeca rosetta]
MAPTKELVQSLFAPNVLVLWTKEAEATCMQRGLSCKHLLAPFGRSRSQAPDVQFRTLDDLRPLVVEDGIAQTKAAVTQHEGLCEDWNIGSGVAPWFNDYCHHFFSLMRPCDHEFFGHPLLRIVLCTAKGDDPITSIASSLSSQKQRDAFSAFPYVSQDIPTCYLLLSDHHDDDATVTAFLQRLSNDFGSKNCFHVPLQQAADGDEEQDVSDVWTTALPALASAAQSRPQSTTEEPTAPPVDADPLSAMASMANADPERVGLAAGFCIADVQKLKDTCAAIVDTALVPAVRHHAQLLSAEVTATRKSRSTFLNATRKWFSSGKSAQSGTGQDPYAPDSFEMQTRRLADLLFMIKEYDDAYQHYRHLRKDFNNDRSWKHLAGANEMLAACMLLDPRLDQGRYESRQLFESAMATYNKSGMPFHTARVAITAAADFTARTQHADAAATFVRVVSEESDLRSAIFLEQAATCYFASPSSRRKAAFHLVLAAFRFIKAHQRMHARRCYVQAEKLFSGLGWQHIEDHIHQSLARQCEQLGLLHKSIDAYAHVLRECPGSARSHSDVLGTFMHLYRHLQESEDAASAPPPLPVPIVNKNIRVRLQLQANTQAAHISQQEEKVAAFMNKPQVHQAAVLSDKTTNTSPATVVVEEPVGVEFQLTNPLATSLRLTALKLVCTLVDADGNECKPDQLELTEMVEIEMGAGEDVDVVLTAMPLTQGTLHVKGIRYNIHLGQSEIAGQQPLLVRGKRLNSTHAERTACVYAPDKRLDLRVVSASPLFTYQSTPLPAEVLRGQVVTVEVDVKNQGTAPTANVVCVFPEHAWKPHIELEDGTQLPAEGQCVDLSSVVQLSPGDATRFRARFQVAPHAPDAFALCIGYRGQNPPQQLPYRMVTLSCRMRAAEGPAVTATIIPTSATRALLRLVFSPVPKDVQLCECLLRNSHWMLDTSTIIADHALPPTPGATRVALLPCVPATSAPSALPPAVSLQVPTNSTGAAGAAQWRLPAFSSDDGVHVLWERNTQLGLAMASLSSGSNTAGSPTAFIDVRKSSSSDASDAENNRQTSCVHPFVCGTGFTPSEELVVQVSQNSNSSGARWLGKERYVIAADEQGQFRIQMTALVLTAGQTVLDGLVVIQTSTSAELHVQSAAVTA